VIYKSMRCVMMKNYAVACVLTMMLCGEAVSGEVVPASKKSPAYLGWTMGAWPNALHHSGLRAMVIERDQPKWSVAFSQADATQTIYAIVGGWIDNWLTYAHIENSQLVLGGTQPYNTGMAIWKISAPPGKRFVSGTVSLRGQAVGVSDPASLKEAFLGIGTTLTLTGGGDFWKGFSDFNRNDFAQTHFADGAESQTLTATIPADVETFYVAAVRGPGMTGQVRIDALTIEATLRDSYGLTIRYDRAEPLWSIGESIVVRVNATGSPAPTKCFWTLTRRNGPICRSGCADVFNGVAKIDLSGGDAGFYTLAVCDNESHSKALDTQDLVILRKQDATITPSDSIFGIHGVAGMGLDGSRRMGIHWTNENVQWAWNQVHESDPITPPNVEHFRQIRAAGIEPIAGIDTAPAWANAGQGAAAPPAPKYYAQWMAYNRTVASTLAGVVTWYETWNEPNNPSGLIFSGSLSDRIAKAKAIQRHQYKALKQGDPNAKLIGGRFAGVPTDWFVQWLSGEDSVRKYQQAMSGHPYCPAFQNEDYAHKRPPEPSLISEITAARKAMDAHGAKDQPLFWTEYGWDVGHTSLDDQARWTARHMIIMQAYRDITRTMASFLFYHWGGYTICEPSQNVSSDGHRFRPVVGAFSTVASVLNGSTPRDRIVEDASSVYAYSFVKGHQTIYAAWAMEESKAYTLNVPALAGRAVRQIGVMGEEQTITVGADGALPLPKNHDPVFYVCATDATPAVDVQKK